MIDFVQEKKIRPVVSRVLELEGGWEDEGALEKLEGLWEELRGGGQCGKLVVGLGGEGEGREGGKGDVKSSL